MINADSFMMFIVFGGLALCGAYFRAQYIDWRRQQTADVKPKLRGRLLYQVESARPQESVVVRAVVDLAGCSLAGSSAYPAHSPGPSIGTCSVGGGARSQSPLPPSVLGKVP